MKPVFALTCGEPAGIGPEIAVKAWEHFRSNNAPFVFFLDFDESQINSLFPDIPTQSFLNLDEVEGIFFDKLPVYQRALQPIKPGVIDKKNSRSVINSVESLVELAQSKKIAGIVTSPIQKAALYDIGFSFPGHTEFLAHLSNRDINKIQMLLTIPELKVIPYTIHIALKDVAEKITIDGLESFIRSVSNNYQKLYNHKDIKIGVCGLNPHAGEEGTIGKEEKEIIEPVIKKLIKEGFLVSGPYSADTIFTQQHREKFDVVICMYHDQALIPVKTLNFSQGVNVTLGLPFIRTSPDHGTALAIAGKNIADASSMIAAIQEAYDIWEAQHHG